MTPRLRARLGQALDHLTEHRHDLGVLTAIAGVFLLAKPPDRPWITLTVPQPLAVITYVVCMIGVIGLLAVRVYESQFIREDWDRIADDADRGARAADTIGELGAAVEELGAAMAELLDELEQTAEPAPVAPEPVTPPRRPTPHPRTDTAPAAAVIADQADDWRSQFTFQAGGRRR